jgi:glycosyltransferase involved in cell wall biosynthesis
MRIALVVHAFPPDSVAGVEVCALRHARALRELGHEVRVVTAVRDLRAATGSARRRDGPGLEVVEVVNNQDGRGLAGTFDCPRVEAAALAALRDHAPELVHFHHLLNLSAGLLPAARALGARTAITLHDYWLSCGRDGLRQRTDLATCERVEPATCARCLASSPQLAAPVERSALSAAAALGLGGVLQAAHRRFPRLGAAALAALRSPAPPQVTAEDVERRATALRSAFAAAHVRVAPTRFAAMRAAEAGLPDVVHVLPNGAVEHEPVPFAPRRRRTIGFVGTLAPHKGPHVLIEAFRGLPDADARLVLRGSGLTAPAYAAELARAAAADPRVRLGGPFAPDDADRAFAEFDLLALPSLWWENAPLVAQEALARGIPVLASAVGGVPEVVAEPWGRCLPPGDVNAWRTALAAALAGRVFAEPLAPAPVWTSARAARALLELCR